MESKIHIRWPWIADIFEIQSAGELELIGFTINWVAKSVFMILKRNLTRKLIKIPFKWIDCHRRPQMDQ